MGVLVGDAERPLVKVQLAEEHRARRPQPLDDRAVPLGNPVAVDARPTRRPHAGGVVQILQRDGDPVQRAAIDSIREVGIGALRLVERAVGGEGDECAKLAVVPRDAIEARANEIDRRHAARVDQRGGGLQREQRDVAHGAEWYERAHLALYAGPKRSEGRSKAIERRERGEPHLALSWLAVDDRSFVRFGGLAAILLALTSWGAVLAYGVLIQPDDPDPRIGLQVFQFLYALIAFWALFAIVAVYYRVRSAGEAWAFFATLIGVAASVGTMVAAVYEVANLRQAPPLVGASPANPLNVMTFGLTSLWFFVVNRLMWRTTTPRLLVLLGFLTAAVLFVGLVSGLSENGGNVYLVSLFGAAIGGPIYWLWLGRQLRRDA